MREKFYNAKDLYIISLCRYTVKFDDEDDYLERACFGYHIAKKKTGLLSKDESFEILTKHNVVVKRFRKREGLGTDEVFPLPLLTKNLPSKVSHSQVVKLEKDLENYYLANKDAIARAHGEVIYHDEEGYYDERSN